MKNYKLVVLFLMLMNTENLPATTWADTKVKDPIFEKQECNVHEPMSYGSYIYQFESKYDLVFWPNTDKNGIWFCEKSGFIAFIQDFEGMSPKEMTEIKKYLKRYPVKNSSMETKLQRMEDIYAIRDKDNLFQNRLLRTLAYWYESLNDYKKANLYREKALSDIEHQLKEDLSELDRLQYLYIAMNYSKQLGLNEKSQTYLKKLKKGLSNIKNDSSKGFKEYINEFIENSKFIKKDGRLAPKIEK